MALLGRIYFNAVFGALGGLLGWMLFGVFGELAVPDERRWIIWLVGGALIGGAVGYLVVGAEAIRDRSLVRFCRLASYGVILGAAGGALGMVIGEEVNFALVGRIGRTDGALPILAAMLARGLGWMFLGLAVGISEGTAARSLGKFSYGTIGGMIGGFIGGALFGGLYLAAIARGVGEMGSALGGAIGLMVLGACIGGLSALVQAVFQPASVRVLRGWQEGREYSLLKSDNLIGRDERADIALFRDMRIEKRHAFIQRENNRFVLVNNHAPAEQTQVNGETVAYSRDLHDGDRIQLGGVVLRFQLRAARATRKIE